VAERHPRGDVRVGQPQVRQVGPDRHVEVELPLLDEPHCQRRGEGLGDRADLEERLFGHRERVLHAGDAQARDALLPAVEYPHRDTRDLQLQHQVGNATFQLLEAHVRAALFPQD
jgi:hypothetical protein